MNNRILVSGATRGVGLAVAERLLSDGYRVVGVGRSMSPCLDQLISTHSAENLQFYAMDLADHSSIKRCVREIVSDGGPLYGLVNNAAIGLDGVLATMHDADISRLIAVNVQGTILLTKYAHRTMLQRKCGRIVNVSSIIARTGFSGLTVYAATKSAIEGFTRSLARELGRVNITVNSVAPGYMATDMSAGLQDEKLNVIRRRSPLKRLVETADVAAATSFLMSADAKNITGTCITVDAGSTA